MPPQWDAYLCDGHVAAGDVEAIRYARMMARKEGILSGFGGGANTAAAFDIAGEVNKPDGDPSSIATMIPDTGLKYLSIDLFLLATQN